MIKQEMGTISWGGFKDGPLGYNPTQYVDYFGWLTKLKHSGTIKDYRTQF